MGRPVITTYSPLLSYDLPHKSNLYPALEQNYHPVGSDGRKHEVWKISHGKRSWDARRRCHPKTGGMALPVHLPEQDRQLFLVVPRPGYGRKPCYLITTQPISSSTSFPDTVIEPESGAETSQLHFIACGLRFLAPASISALLPLH